MRELLRLDSPQEPDEPSSPLQPVADLLGKPSGTRGYYSRGVFLPAGTRLRARYKGREYGAQVADEKWIDEEGREHTSPSAAAAAITGTTVNGLRFWEAMRPSDSAWIRLELLRPR